MEVLIVLILMVVALSLLTTYEVIALKKFDFDIIAHLKGSWDSGNKAKFAFEAFGVVAFILIQPVILTATVVWAFGEVSEVMRLATELKSAILGIQ
ncbi:hypothetical protein [Zobellella sp. An-6]|uniref:hypothetical protein n=1 Tax=Zobellella sp. An-6 TaxID=3400218 RepID=UPI0040420C7F